MPSTTTSTSAARPRILKRLSSLILILSVATAAFFGLRFYRAERQPGPRFETVKVDRGRIAARVTATGTLSALVTVQVGSQVSGRIILLGADFNSPVKKGQVIAKIDPQPLSASLDQARANYVAAKGNLAKSKAQAEDALRQAGRNQQLFARNLIAEADRDTSLATAEAAKADVHANEGSVEQAQASLHSAEINLTYTTIRSPIDGTVISRSVDVGQTVAASLQAPTLFTIAEDLKKMQVDTDVAESDVGRLEPGATATFTVDAYPSERFHGTVRQIRNAPQMVQNVVTYDAVIDVDNGELKLKPGMTANVAFIVAEVRDAVRLANAALRFRPPSDLSAPSASHAGGRDAFASGVVAPASAAQALESKRGDSRALGGDARKPLLDTRTVWVLQGASPEPRSVRIGITDGSYTELVDGAVTQGELLITGLTSDASPPGAKGPGSTPPSGAARRLF